MSTYFMPTSNRMNFYQQRMMEQQNTQRKPAPMTTANTVAGYPATPPGPNTDGFPEYQKLGSYPTYNPYINEDRTLAKEATLNFNPINTNLTSDNLLKAFDINRNMAATDLKNQMNQSRQSALNPLLSKGIPTDSLAELTDRMNKNDQQQMTNFYQQALAQRFGIEDQNAARNLDLSKWNSQQQMNAGQFNIQNLLAENRFKNQSDVQAGQLAMQDNNAWMDYWMKKYMTDKGLEGSQAAADAMKKSKSGGLLGLGLGGIL